MQAGRDEQLNKMLQMAMRRHIPPDWAESRMLRWTSLLKRGDYDRLVKWARAMLPKQLEKKDFIIISISQNPGFGATVTERAPALLRGSHLWICGRDFSWRPITAPELLAIQGFPVFLSDLQIPLTTAMLQIISEPHAAGGTEVRRQSGNAMHHAAVGAPLLFALLSLQRR